MRGLLQKEIKLDTKQIKDFIVKNKRIVAVSGAGLAVVIIALIIFLTMNPGKDTPANNDPAASQQPVYSYLPENTRVTGERAGVRDPFTGALALKGVITGEGEDNVAIIEAGNISYVARKGAVVAGGWTVDSIKSDAVYLKAGDRKIRLDFNGRVKNIDVKPAANTGDNQSGPKETAGSASGQAAEEDKSQSATGEGGGVE
ncbi:hypothetical protein DCCM_0957 [Desulfocucumis palustris]|uniref:Type IV pilus biogenesis protein PilP n=1 Tax=Desulfocucumis palustris TaxID=1898651 RepID=A0A2L2XFW4_9FIRM|nr:hypothetical protein [Desulfocucumis palustris]GBF32761.1 hypothetical protein DCCM_0957 [Desulfocucumis palustris]